MLTVLNAQQIRNLLSYWHCRESSLERDFTNYALGRKHLVPEETLEHYEPFDDIII